MVPSAATPEPNLIVSRKGAKAPRGSLSFRPKGEIFLRSLTFVRDDGAWPVTLRSWRLGARIIRSTRLRLLGNEDHRTGGRCGCADGFEGNGEGFHWQFTPCRFDV